MLKIIVELHPHGDEYNKKKIAEMVIANTTGLDDEIPTAYQGWIAPDDWSREPAMFGRIAQFDRSESVWELIRLMLEACRLEKHTPSYNKDSISQRLRKRLFR